MKKRLDGYRPEPEDLTQPNIPSTWKAMEPLYDSGKARSMGVSNFSVKKLQDLLEIARIPPAVNQVECHPIWQQPILHSCCKYMGIRLSVSVIHQKGFRVFEKIDYRKEINFTYAR